LLRRQITWLFIFSWLAVGLSNVPSFDQNGFTKATFYQSWADFLSFGNLYMNLFNLGYLISFLTSVFMNKYDSSFNMLTSNISAVLSLWTGWVPSIRDQTVGFTFSIPLTVIAMVLSCIAVYPSFKYSIKMKELIQLEHRPTGHTLIHEESDSAVNP